MKCDICTLVIPPNIQAMMTGVNAARIFPDGRVELEYCDLTKESAILSPAQLAEGGDNFFSLVSDVQDKRGNQ